MQFIDLIILIPIILLVGYLVKAKLKQRQIAKECGDCSSCSGCFVVYQKYLADRANQKISDSK